MSLNPEAGAFCLSFVTKITVAGIIFSYLLLPLAGDSYSGFDVASRFNVRFLVREKLPRLMSSKDLKQKKRKTRIISILEETGGSLLPAEIEPEPF